MSHEQKIYLTLVVSIAIIIVLLLVLICPLVSKIKALSTELREKNSIVSSYKEKSGDYLQRLRNEYLNSKPEISEVSGSFVNSEKVIDFILAVEQIAILTNNYQEIEEVSSPVDEAGGPEERILFFQISSWGDFPSLLKFLVQLENMDYFVNSDSIQISRIEKRELRNLRDKKIIVSAGDVRSVINIKVYTR